MSLLVEKGEYMKKKLILLLTLLSTAAFANQTIGVGGYYKESIYNAKKQVNIIPITNLHYKDFYMRGTKIGYKLYEEPNFEFSVIGDFLGGYTDFAIRKSELKKGFNKIESRKTQLIGGFALDFKLDRTSIGHASYFYGKNGSKGSIKLNKIFQLNDRVSILPGISFNYYDSKYMDYYIGLDDEDVKNNLLIKKKYKGKDIISGGINTTVEISLTEQTSVSVFGGYEYYDSKIKKSDLVKDNKQIYGGIGIRYSF